MTWPVTFPGGYSVKVRADSESEAKRVALDTLIRRGHTIDSKTDLGAKRIEAVKTDGP